MKRIFLAAYGDIIRLGKDDSGVALVLTLCTFMFMFLLCCGVYAIGDTVRQKIELQNAADAAAYSAAVIQADTISRIATINRAMSWTYVQMTRRQLDFIVDQWLRRTKKVYDDDLRAVKKWNRMSICIPCDKGHNSGQERADTCWCGIDAQNIGVIRVNGLSTVFDDLIPGIVDTVRNSPFGQNLGFGRDLAIEDIAEKIESWNTYSKLAFNSGNRLAMNYFYADTGLQILLDKLNISAMNLAEMDLVLQMPDRIKTVVNGILKANLPKDLVDEDYFQYYLYQNEHPYSYFRLLNNTKEDEQIFLSFADYYDAQHKTFKGDPSLFCFLSDFMSAGESLLLDRLGFNIAGGVDRWFVRGNGSRRAKDSDIGIQRSYKMWPEDILKSLHPSKHLPILPPTCFNFNGDDNKPSKLTDYRWRSNSPYPSIGLYSEWQWYSMLWFCFLNPVPIPHVIHRSVISMLWCDHCSFNLKITKDKNCLIWPGKAEVFGYKIWKTNRWGIPRRRSVSTGGVGTTDFGIPVIRGYTRVYGDDEMILAQHKDKYIGAKCMPLLLSPAFFGKPGSIIVGVARKSENPFKRILNYVGGIFSAFDEKESDLRDSAGNVVVAGKLRRPPHMWAVSAARAGYRKVDGKNGEYHIVWDDPSDLRQRWNLKQVDWDAVFLPVRDAWKLGAWNMFVPGIFSNDDNILEDLMTSSWGGSQGWNKLSPPAGMHEPGDSLDWKKMAEFLVH